MLQIDGLNTIGLVNITYPPALRLAVENAERIWRDFCDMRQEQKIAFTYNDVGNLDGAGYEYKPMPGATRDFKENFHVTLEAMSRLSHIARYEVRVSAALDFLDTSLKLFDYVMPIILEFAFAVQVKFGLKGFVDEVMNSQNRWILRYLHYFGGREPNDVLASAHPDKSGFTLHLYESDPGLEYPELEPSAMSHGIHTGRRIWRDMPVSDGQTVIIPNIQLQYRSKGQLKALYHRVVATEKTAREGRYSMVLFVPLMETPLFNKNGKGRLQDFPIGFNYDMPFEEFSQLFEQK